MRLLLYEHLTASAGCGPDLPASLAREGRAMLSAILQDCQEIPKIEPHTLLGPAIEKDLPGKIHHVNATQDWLSNFNAVLEHVDACLIIAPEFERILVTLARCAEDRKKPLLGCASSAIALAADKWACGRHLQVRGIPTPECVAFHTDHIAKQTRNCEYPLVLKPRDGAGSLATILIPDAGAREQAMAAVRHENPGEEWIVQAFVPGKAASVACIVHVRGVLTLPAAAQHLSIDGRFRYGGGELPLDPPLEQRAQRLARRAVSAIDRLWGYVGVDLILGSSEDGSDDYVIEINPRITTSYLGLRALCHQNILRVIMNSSSGQAHPPLSWRAGKLRFQPDGTICEISRSF